jgi:hypothetical protein
MKKSFFVFLRPTNQQRNIMEQKMQNLEVSDKPGQGKPKLRSLTVF